MIGGMIGTAEEIIHWLFEQPKGEQLYEIKERKRKRTLTQNAYYWSMLNQLGKTLRIPTSDLHFHMLKEHAPYEVVSVRSYIDVSGYRTWIRRSSRGSSTGRVKNAKRRASRFSRARKSHG